MGFLNTNSMPRLVEKLSDANNIKITGNSKGNRVGTVINKIVEKADDVTKAIEQEVVNEGYSFKVGTGDVDVSSSVEDGFGEVGTKGITYQNLFNDTTSVVNGVYNINTKEFTNTSNEWFRIAKTGLLKQNTTYTLIFLYKSTVDKINVRAEFDLPINNSSSVCKDFGDISATTTYQQFKKTFSTNGNVDILRLLIRNCYDGTVSIKYPVILEGDHTSNLKLPSYFEGIVGVGDKSKNLFNPKDLVVGALNFAVGSNINQIVNHTTTRLRSDVSKPIEIKPNTQYSIKLNQNFSIGFQEYDSNKIALRDSYWRTGEVKITTTSNSKYVYFVIKRNGTESPIEIKELDNGVLQIEEGDTLSEYQPYGTHKIEILSCGKNLFNESKHLFNVSIGSESSKKWGTGKGGNRWSLKVPCKPNTTYTITKIGGDRFGVWTNSFDFDGNKEQELDNLVANNIEEKTFTFTTPPNAKVVCIYLSLNEKSTNIHLEESPTPTPYAPYQQDKTQILLDEPLMRLPNGVCDEITRDGKLIRRVGKVVLDGSEAGWKSYADKEGCWMFAVDNYPSNLKHRLYENTNLICDITPIGNLNIEKKQRSIFVYGHTANNELRYAIPKTILAGNATHLFKQWLQANPTTIYYELAEPIVTELPAPYLRIFKDGHLTFNTLVAPESTHVVQLNKSAQIERSIREVQGLDGRVEKLESFYDDMILETSHKLNLLNFDFDYMRNTEDEI